MRCRLLLVIAALLGIAGRSAASGRDILLLADQWCPYNCDPSSDYPGYAIEIAHEALLPDGLNVVYRTMTWSRSMEEARVGHADAVIGITMDEARGFVFPHEPIGVSTMGFVVRSDSDFRYDGPPSLDGHVIGLAAGYVFGGPAGRYIQQHEGDRARVQVVPGEDALALNLRKLQAGRIDIVVDDANVLSHVLSVLGPATHLRLAASAGGLPVYIAFSPAAPDAQALCSKLDAGIRRLRSSGRLARILGRYQLRDWK